MTTEQANQLEYVYDNINNVIRSTVPVVVTISVSEKFTTDVYKLCTGTVTYNNATILTVTTPNTYRYNTGSSNITSSIYTIPETGQEIYIYVYGSAGGNSNTLYGIDLYVNGLKIRSLSGSAVYSGLGSQSDTWNICGY